MNCPEFKVTAKVTITRTVMDWKSGEHVAEGKISLLNADDTVIQTFPFKTNLVDGEALKRFSELISQEQTMRILSGTEDKPVVDEDDNAAKISRAISGLKAKGGKPRKSSLKDDSLLDAFKYRMKAINPDDPDYPS